MATDQPTSTSGQTPEPDGPIRQGDTVLTRLSGERVAGIVFRAPWGRTGKNLSIRTGDGRTLVRHADAVTLIARPASTEGR